MEEQHGQAIGEESGQVQQLIVLGMGKLVGNELNVSSDIDLIFVTTKMAKPTLRVIKDNYQTTSTLVDSVRN